jgi:hypothetical protein
VKIASYCKDFWTTLYKLKENSAARGTIECGRAWPVQREPTSRRSRNEVHFQDKEPRLSNSSKLQTVTGGTRGPAGIMMLCNPLRENADSSIRRNFDPVSNVSDLSERSFKKHDLHMISTYARLITFCNLLDKNADILIHCNFDPVSNSN